MTMNDTIAMLVRRMKDGDEGAFDRLYEQYVKKLYAAAYLISGSRTDSEDIVQETFVTCFLKRDTLREAQAFERWLYQILVRTAWRFLKKKGRQCSYEQLLDEEEACFGRWLELDRDTLEPSEEMILREEREVLQRAVGCLELKQRTVIILYYFNDLTVREIAQITGSFEGTVKSRLHKARENLRRMLEEAPEAPEGRTAVSRGRLHKKEEAV